MTLEEIDKEIKEHEKEIYNLRRDKEKIIEQQYLNVLKEGSYYEMHINECDIIWFKYTKDAIWYTYDDKKPVIKYCLKMHLTRASMWFGWADNIYLEKYDFSDAEEITEEAFKEELKDAINRINSLVSEG